MSKATVIWGQTSHNQEWGWRWQQQHPVPYYLSAALTLSSWAPSPCCAAMPHNTPPHHTSENPHSHCNELIILPNFISLWPLISRLAPFLKKKKKRLLSFLPWPWMVLYHKNLYYKSETVYDCKGHGHLVQTCCQTSTIINKKCPTSLSLFYLRGCQSLSVKGTKPQRKTSYYYFFFTEDRK